MTEFSQYEGMIERLEVEAVIEGEESVTMTRRCDNGDHDHCPGTWARYPDEEGPCECECHSEDDNA